LHPSDARVQQMDLLNTLRTLREKEIVVCGYVAPFICTSSRNIIVQEIKAGRVFVFIDSHHIMFEECSPNYGGEGVVTYNISIKPVINLDVREGEVPYTENLLNLPSGMMLKSHDYVSAYIRSMQPYRKWVTIPEFVAFFRSIGYVIDEGTGPLLALTFQQHVRHLRLGKASYYVTYGRTESKPIPCDMRAGDFILCTRTTHMGRPPNDVQQCYEGDKTYYGSPVLTEVETIRYQQNGVMTNRVRFVDETIRTYPLRVEFFDQKVKFSRGRQGIVFDLVLPKEYDGTSFKRWNSDHPKNRVLLSDLCYKNWVDSMFYDPEYDFLRPD